MMDEGVKEIGEGVGKTPEKSEKAELKKVLGFKAILIITINSIIGTGIFFLPATGAKHAGPASILSWMIMAAISIYISMCFGELVSMFPKAGGVYEYCKQAYGRFPSFIFGWMTLIAGNITLAMLIVGAIQYLLPFPLTFVKVIISLFFILVFNYMAFKGMQTSAFMLITFGIITIGTLVSLIIPGLFTMQLGNFTPFFIFPLSTIFITVFFIAETFFGWETATFLAEETKDAEHVMPKALIYGTIIIATICLLFVVTSLGVIPWQTFSESVAPIANLASVYYGGLGVDIFTILVYLSIIGSVAGWIVSAPRLILALAQDNLFLNQFARIHPKNFTPHMAILLQTVLTSILVIIGSSSPNAYQTLLILLVPMVLMMYSGVLISIVVLRYTKPDIPRPYKVPFGKIGPIVVVVFSLSLIGIWLFEETGAFQSLKLGLSIISIGLPLYFLLEMYYNPRAIVEVNDVFAYLALLTEKIMLPKKMKNTIFQMLGDLRNKSVLEYGCNIGTLTKHLAVAVKPDGKVYALSHLRRASRITQKRMDKKGHSHVSVIHDPVPNRIHPATPQVDAAVSVGQISYVQNLNEVLVQINRRMSRYDRIVFVDYDKYFDVIPNIDWLADDKKIHEIFSAAGFNVEILRKQGLAWQYIYIFGEKDREV